MTRARSRTSAAALLAVAALLVSGGAAGQGGAPAPSAAAPVATTAADSLLDARTREVAAQLRCPVCQGLSLQDSPSELSLQMRDVVRQQLAAGRTPDEVKAYFVGRYGEWILMAPPAHGFNVLVYVLPGVGLLVGAALLVVVVRRWTADGAGDPARPTG